MRQRRIPNPFTLILAVLMLAGGPGAAWAQGPTLNNVPAKLVQYPDEIYMDAHIVTLDDHKMNADPGTIVQAMAIRKGTILALGSDKEVLALAGPKTEIVDLKGKTVLPGIVESHVHPMAPSTEIARKKFHLRSTPEGYALTMSVGATPDETLAKVGQAMKVLLSKVKPKPNDWINISLLHNPELGFASPADVSTLMSTPKLSDVKISKSDISEIVPNYPFVLSSASAVLTAPKKDAWYHITAGPNGQPVATKIVDFK